MKKHKVFISYSHHSLDLAKKICDYLEANDIPCWYAPRDVVGDYATSICDAIDKAEVFVVLLDKEASNSQHVLNEVEMEYKNMIEDKKEVYIIPFVGKDKDISKAMQYYVKRMHWVDYAEQDIDSAIEELKGKIEHLLAINKNRDQNAERTATLMYKTNDETENKRLHIQQEALAKFDGDTFKEIASEFESLNILDIGCHQGDYINRNFKGEKINQIIGLDFNEYFIKAANEKYGGEHQAFYLCDVEKELDEVLEVAMRERAVAGFNVIHVSMILLHLAKPKELLKRLRRYLVKDGYIVIKDIDDGYNVAYPDPDGIFEIATELCLRDPDSGNRQNGRTIPFILAHTGYRNIELKNLCMNTCGMDYDAREAFFDLYFGFIKYDYENHLYNFGDKRFEKGVEFFKENYEKMKDLFLEDQFFYTLGFMQFIAKR